MVEPEASPSGVVDSEELDDPWEALDFDIEASELKG